MNKCLMQVAASSHPNPPCSHPGCVIWWAEASWPPSSVTVYQGAPASPLKSQSKYVLICKTELTPTSQYCCEIKQTRYLWQWLANGREFTNISYCYYYHLTASQHWSLQRLSLTRRVTIRCKPCYQNPPQSIVPLLTCIFFPPRMNHLFQPYTFLFFI